MRILFVAIPHSIHTARWIDQLNDQGWDLHLVPSQPAALHSLLQGKVSFHRFAYVDHPVTRRLAIKILSRWPYARGSGHAKRLIEKLNLGTSAYWLEHVIRSVKPDLVHSLEIQHAGYLTLGGYERSKGSLPPWLVSNWGSDIYLFGNLASHRAQVRRVMETCSHYTCECQRDVALARQYGFTGEVMPVLPAGGGFHLEQMQDFRQPGPVSARRTILLKGYQNFAGRALAGLRAIEMCADLLTGYRVIIQIASPDVQMAAELVAARTGIQIEIVDYSDYTDALRRFGAARVHMGLSISDGISQSLLEAMVMGAFPIQSCTACADEWVEDGKGGFIVPPEDPQLIAAALRQALTDDQLVDQAAAINAEIAQQRLAHTLVKDQAVAMYKSIQTTTRPRTSMTR